MKLKHLLLLMLALLPVLTGCGKDDEDKPVAYAAPTELLGYWENDARAGQFLIIFEDGVGLSYLKPTDTSRYFKWKYNGSEKTLELVYQGTETGEVSKIEELTASRLKLERNGETTVYTKRDGL